ncbi:UNVERIFIED_CONTAM: hypothetical protein Sradi_0475200 [Sesamum radiatum]|uniref:Uncharacterized protein n=1 Tax=Sesamum radiatum TaxID=300843 RepID=A0AAW2W8C0_SESRA
MVVESLGGFTPNTKKPRIDIRDKKPPFQRVNAVPLTVPITQAFMAVEEKGLLTRPRGPSGGDSHCARKSQIREAHDISLKEVIEVEAVEDTPLIQFGRAERSGPRTSRNDAIVITAVLADYEVGRIFIDSGSSADIHFEEAYDQMQLGDISLEKVNTSLYGFAGRGGTSQRHDLTSLDNGSRNHPEDLYAEISNSRRALCIQCNLGKAHSYVPSRVV